MVAENNIQLWVDESERIVSFHAVPDFVPRLFSSRDEMFEYIKTALDGKGYRFQ